LLPSLRFITSAHVFIQADAETDEVYAQMTLRPLSPVREDFLAFPIHALTHLLSLILESIFGLIPFSARAEGLIFTCQLSHCQQATNKLLLQNVNCK
jgi:hypothetical protein